jgi:hypothetical protein
MQWFRAMEVIVGVQKIPNADLFVPAFALCHCEYRKVNWRGLLKNSPSQRRHVRTIERLRVNCEASAAKRPLF